MALVACNNCGHLISSRARSCPKCAAAAHPAPTSTAPAQFAAPNAAFAAAAEFPSFQLPSFDSSPTKESADERGLSLFSRFVARLRMRRAANSPEEEAALELTAEQLLAVSQPLEPSFPEDRSDRQSAAVTKEEWLLREAPQVQEAVEFSGDPHRQEETEEDVYYLTGAGRIGPVPLSHVYKLVAQGELDLDTPLSKEGTSDWLTFTEFLKARDAENGATKGKGGRHTPPGAVPWGAALAPLMGGAVPVLATQAWISLGHRPLPYQAHLWWVVPMISSAVCCLDCRALRKAGQGSGRLDLCLSLVPPLYLYRRAKSALALIVSAFIWCASSLVALAGFVLVNGYNAPLLTVIKRMVHVQCYLP